MRKRRQRPGLKTCVRDIELQALNTLALAGRVPRYGLNRNPWVVSRQSRMRDELVRPRIVTRSWK